MYKSQWWCRWCSKLYEPVKRTPRDGFCSTSCKQALWRAVQRYVTSSRRQISTFEGQGVTPKKTKRKGKKNGKVKRK